MQSKYSQAAAIWQKDRAKACGYLGTLEFWQRERNKVKIAIVLSLAATILPQTISAAATERSSVQEWASEAASLEYPETTEGLKKLLGDWLMAMKSGDLAKSDAILKGFVIPDHAIWFANTFGYSDGPSLEVAFSQLQPGSEDRWKMFGFRSIEAERLVVNVSAYAKPGDTQNALLAAALTAEKQPTTFYCAELVKSGDETARSRIGCFVYVAGGFRFLDQGVLQALSTAPRSTGPRQLRLLRDAPGPKLIQTVLPTYPDDVKKNKVEGVVRLYIEIQKDGAVGAVYVMDGDPRLSAAAVAAVKQWRYEPRIVDGNPVDTRIIVEIPFRLDP
jgi:TonB family protein